MSEHDDVRPWLDDPELSSDLRTVLGAADAHQPSASDLDGLGKKLAAALPPGTLPGGGGGGGGAAGSAAGGLGATKMVLGIGVVGAVVAALVAGGTTRTSAPARTNEVVTSLPSAPLPPPLPSGPSSVVSAPELPSAATPPARPPVPSAPPRAPAPAASTPAETTLLRDAHDALLGGTPARALELASDHAHAYPRGALAQEREVIAIEALVRLGRRDEALARARAFHAAYPGSSHGERVDRLVEGR